MSRHALIRFTAAIAGFSTSLLLCQPARAQSTSSNTQAPAPTPFGSYQTNPLLGGVPSGTATAQTLELSLGDAITRALANNLGALTSEQDVDRARGARLRALSELLPNLNGRVAEARQQTNLEAFGFSFPGLPTIVGPFNTFDARVYLTQSIVDLKAINDVRAESHNVAAARHSYKNTRELVVLVGTNLYLQGLAASSRADAARAQLATAQALYDQAVDLRQNGLVAGIDVVRAEVQLSTERQRATATRNEFEKEKLQLARVIGLPVGQAFALTDQLPAAPVPDVTMEQALERAYQTRSDYLAAVERVNAAAASRRAAVGEALPSVHLTADFGDIGLSVSDSHGTFSIAGAVTVPIFQGGKTQGRIREAEAELRTRRAESEDLKAGIYYEVRTAFLDLQASDEQLQVATKARDLAADQLVQARDRFAAGVADNLEVVQAQEAVALANDQHIAALYSFNAAKASLARALGIAEEATRRYLGGSQP